MEQLLAHIFGDFILQSDWMAMNKNKKTFNCLVHVLIYTSVFILLGASWQVLLVIGSTHFILDRFPIIIKKLIWWKNHFPTGKYPPFPFCDTTGYYDDSPYNTANNQDIITYGNTFIDQSYQKPPTEWGVKRHFFITVWLYIITDNFLHLTINYFALKYL